MIATASAGAYSTAQLAKGEAFQYAISTYQTVLGPSGLHWTDEEVAEPTGRGETIEGEQVNVHCAIRRHAAFGSCTVKYFLSTEWRNPLVPCVQKVRARNLALRGAFRTAKRRGEFIYSNTEAPERKAAYSYQGYAITCTFQDPQHTAVVFPGDRH
jgi:hypothetical protein